MPALPEQSEQLDIFAHSRDVMLRNDVLLALEARDAHAAPKALRALADEFPIDPSLGALRTLVPLLGQPPAPALKDADELERERERLSGEVARAAHQALGSGPGRNWMLPLWRALALRAAGLPFLAAREDDCAAPLWLRAEARDEAALAVERIESWRRIPAPLAWMAEARFRLHGLDEAWPLLTELAWLAPARFAPLVQRLADPLLLRLHQAFGEAFDDAGAAADAAWFPAWALIEKPALAARLALAQAGQQRAPERCMRLVLELLGLERQGRHAELVQRRKALRDLHALLFTLYMATR